MWASQTGFGFILAGMPMVELTDIAKLRLNSISFFLLVLVICAWGVQTLWNVLARDFPQLPKIRYRTALAGTVLWGLMFLIVLTMISGARELLTPGAWKKSGLTYVLAGDGAESSGMNAPPRPPDLRERQARLELLRMLLWTYAATHDGAFPASPDESGISQIHWRQPGHEHVSYGYHAGRRLGETEPLAFEYDVYGDGRRLMLDAAGVIREMSSVAETNLSTEADE